MYNASLHAQSKWISCIFDCTLRKFKINSAFSDYIACVRCKQSFTLSLFLFCYYVLQYATHFQNWTLTTIYIICNGIFLINNISLDYKHFFTININAKRLFETHTRHPPYHFTFNKNIHQDALYIRESGASITSEHLILRGSNTNFDLMDSIKSYYDCLIHRHIVLLTYVLPDMTLACREATQIIHVYLSLANCSTVSQMLCMVFISPSTVLLRLFFHILCGCTLNKHALVVISWKSQFILVSHSTF